jgi:hypothetical protein
MPMPSAQGDAVLPPGTQRPPSLRPRSARDLLLAPVAAAIDGELQYLRDLTVAELRLELDALDRCETREDRAASVLRAALREVDTHGWYAELTDDSARLRLTGGSVSLDLGLSPSLISYLQGAGDRA